MKQEISIVMPCYNEEQSLGFCIDEIRRVSQENNLNLEIIVVDNASTDRSPIIAKQKNVRYIFEGKKGYGNACLTGLKSAQGDYILMTDCDGSYDFRDISSFLIELKKGDDFIIGYRKDKSSLPYLNRFGGWVINKLLSLNGLKIKESCTGFIGIKKEKLKLLNLKGEGMEFSSEFLVRAKEMNLNIKEIEINFRPRIGESKLNLFVDGMRHLRVLFSSLIFLAQKKGKYENRNFS